MFLSQIKITGFKSYTETVTVDFGPEIAVIIGNNGVGKSNALDAITWGLGENDLRALRISRQGDLFFAGSGETPPVQEIGVELTFEHDHRKTVLTRRMKKSGWESFSTNGETITDRQSYLKALTDLGLDSARRNLIRQEQISDFFVRPSEERRAYLDQFISSPPDLVAVNTEFSENLNKILPGSRAGLIMGQDHDPPEVEVYFPDKGAKRGLFLSGGERAVTSLALKLALFARRPSPFYLLDEVEPSLDWTRNHNTQELLKSVACRRQLIMITHLQGTIQMANTVHGVRIRPDGSSWLKFHMVMDERLLKVYGCCC